MEWKRTRKVKSPFLIASRILHIYPRDRKADVGQPDDAGDTDFEFGPELHLHPPEHDEGHREQKAVREDMPHAKADAHVDERHALGLDVPPSNLPDVAVVRIALGHGQDE